MRKFIFAAGALLASMGPGFASGAMADEDLDRSGYKPMPTAIHLEWKPEKSTAVLRFSTGCLSTQTGHMVAEDLSVELDRETGRLEINGSYLHQPPENPRMIGSADCMGSRVKTVEIPHLTGGNYEVLRNGKLLWNVELADEPLEMTLGLDEARAGQLIKRKTFNTSSKTWMRHKGINASSRALRPTGSVRVSKGTLISKKAMKDSSMGTAKTEGRPPRFCYCMPRSIGRD
ncbi:hypothetical protein [Roseibium sp.]|uniref:hypothetical protein n=1 Tax=Roseibium sp. TaxID=1936156 RepID=UPI003A98365D